MGCQQPNSAQNGQLIRIIIVDPCFMKIENDWVRKRMNEQNISYEYYISSDCFLDQFTKKYCNNIVTIPENYQIIFNNLDKMGLSPNIYVVLEGQGQLLNYETSFNTIGVNDYGELVRYLRQHQSKSIPPGRIQNKENLNLNKKKVQIKFLGRPGLKTSEESIFQAAVKKYNISLEVYNNFHALEKSTDQSDCNFVVTDYMFHKQVAELFKKRNSKVICFSNFEAGQTYSPNIYFVSNNYIDIANEIQCQIKRAEKNCVSCSKVYIYSRNLPENQEIKQVIQQFGIQARIFDEIEKIISETTYFFCVTIISVEEEVKNIRASLIENDYEDRVRLLSISRECPPTVKGLFRLIRNIKKGYSIKKGQTNSIDIIDKHYDNTKFQQIKKELKARSIKWYGFKNLNSYIKNKKFISPFIICNFEEKQTLSKYLKKLESRSKVIVFCNKTKITSEAKKDEKFFFISSHFGKILQLIHKTTVYQPVIEHQQDIQFKQNMENIKKKNQRISALQLDQVIRLADQQFPFQFLNVAKDTNTNSIKDIQKSVSTLWQVDSSVSQLDSFKQQFEKCLRQLGVASKVKIAEIQLNNIIKQIKQASFFQLVEKAKSFLEVENHEIADYINKSLIKTEALDKKEIICLRSILLLLFLNFFGPCSIPKMGKRNLSVWISNPIIENCQIGSFLFAKHFLIFEEKSDLVTGKSKSKYKLELQLQFNTLTESDLFISSFIQSDSGYIFPPFSQFQIQGITKTEILTTIKVKYIKNPYFLKQIYQQNMLEGRKADESFAQLFALLSAQLQSPKLEEFQINYKRLQSLLFFHQGLTAQAISIHQKLKKQMQQKENFNSLQINELSFELCCFYFKANCNKQAAIALKQLLQSNPGEFIESQSSVMIKDVIENLEIMNESRKRRISEEAMRTFIWLNNKEQRKSEMSFEGSEEEEFPVIFEQNMNCIEIQDINCEEEKQDKGLQLQQEGIINKN